MLSISLFLPTLAWRFGCWKPGTGLICGRIVLDTETEGVEAKVQWESLRSVEQRLTTALQEPSDSASHVVCSVSCDLSAQVQIFTHQLFIEYLPCILLGTRGAGVS